MTACRFLKWDSDWFGVRVGRVEGGRLTPEIAAEIETWRRRERIDVLYFLADAAEDATVALAEQDGFHLVDFRVVLERQLDDAADDSPPPSIRPMRGDDLPALRAMARASHRDSRFYRDERFPAERVDAMFERWLENGFAKFPGHAWTALNDNRPAGYIVCEPVNAELGQIGLIAVEPASRGKGLGAGLIAASLNGFRAQGIRRVQVATQGANLAAQRLYHRCGFLTCAVGFWYHRWFDSPPDAEAVP